MKVGVFDSGIGGKAVANAIRKAIPGLEVVHVDDKEHVPYGTKPPETIHGYVLPILKSLVAEGCQVIVIACNTVTMTLIDQLRQELSVPLIGIEPMVKPAAAISRSGVIAVCATPTTLGSRRYDWLKQTYASNVVVLEPDCSDWSVMIENNRIDKENIRERIEAVCCQGADVIVLGCTHYHWIEDIIKEVAAPRALILQPEEPVIARLLQVMEGIAKGD